MASQVRHHKFTTELKAVEDNGISRLRQQNDYALLKAGLRRDAVTLLNTAGTTIKYPFSVTQGNALNLLACVQDVASATG